MAHHTHDEAVAGRPAAATLEAGVVPLKDLKDYKVAKGDPDVRGWVVESNDGRRLGKVDDLLVDTAAMKVRYLDVELDREVFTNVERDIGEPGVAERHSGHVLVPIGSARLHAKDDRVEIDLLHTLIGGLPTYEHTPVTREYETSLRQRFDRDYRPAPDRDRDFYDSDLYNEDRFYGPRRRR
jgi:PRC-barrel domain protein